MSRVDVIIIGAGISGLLCATELQRAGLSVRVIDKGRGVGGRMSTRRMSGARLDHGAQFFTVRDTRFQEYVDEWLGQGIVREWFRHSTENSHPEGYPRYCGINGMSDAPKFLAEELDVINSERVSDVSREIEVWVVRTESGMQLTADYLVVTTPLPQALDLLDTSGLDYAGEDIEALRNIRYSKGLATMVLLDGPSGVPEDGYIRILNAPLSWIADNQIKGISPDVSAVTIHADAEFAEQHWDSPDEIRGPLMLEAAEPWLGSQVQEYKCHRWGFTLPQNPWHDKQFSNAALKLTLAGDAFGGARVEGSALSGIEAARAVLQNIGISLRGS